jgi:small subunit ribosomal protein S9
MVDKEIISTSGKRKTSIARGTIRLGAGIIRINKMRLEVYGTELERNLFMEPLIIAGENVFKKVNIDITVNGGGWQSQTEAARIVLSKLLVKYTKDKELEKKFLEYDRHLLVADTRRTEPQKPYRSAARRVRQISKR